MVAHCVVVSVDWEGLMTACESELCGELMAVWSVLESLEFPWSCRSADASVRHLVTDV